MATKWADDVRVGDRIVWCGFDCEVVKVRGPSAENNGSRLGVRLNLVTADGARHNGLHWFANEAVRLVERGNEQEKPDVD